MSKPYVIATIPMDEQALLLAAAQGDSFAAKRIYRDHVARIERTARRVLGAMDADVDDVVHETFLAALEGAAAFDARSSLSTWLIGIATRRALDAARARYRRNRWSRMAEAVGLGRSEARPDLIREAHQAAEWGLSKLTPEQRVAFVLVEVEGYTLAEVESMTGAKLSTLHARVAAARKRLAALFAEGNEP